MNEYYNGLFIYSDPKMRKGVVKEICSLERCVRQSVYMNLQPPTWTLYLAGRKKSM